MTSILVIITGASRGIGRSCALSCSKIRKGGKIHLCLLARSLDGLEETVTLIQDTIDSESSSTNHDDAKESILEKEMKQWKNQGVTITIQKVDLAELDTLEEVIQNMMEEKVTPNFNEYDHCILINNAGSLGHLGIARSISSPKDIQSNTDLNMASSCWLSSYFLTWFHKSNSKKGQDENEASSKRCTIVNISSLCAIESFPTMAMYCAGKAYRDMYHQTMAVEEKDNPSIRVLNYAPGAIDTEMTEKLSQCDVLDANLSEFFKTKDENIFVKVDDSTRKLMNLVMEGNYESGKHVDFWDDVNTNS